MNRVAIVGKELLLINSFYFPDLEDGEVMVVEVIVFYGVKLFEYF
jgi:hypothetical protein